MPDLHPDSLRAAQLAYARHQCPWLDDAQLAKLAPSKIPEIAIAAYLAAEAERGCYLFQTMQDAPATKAADHG